MSGAVADIIGRLHWRYGAFCGSRAASRAAMLRGRNILLDEGTAHTSTGSTRL